MFLLSMIILSLNSNFINNKKYNIISNQMNINIK